MFLIVSLCATILYLTFLRGWHFLGNRTNYVKVESKSDPKLLNNFTYNFKCKKYVPSNSTC